MCFEILKKVWVDLEEVVTVVYKMAWTLNPASEVVIINYWKVSQSITENIQPCFRIYYSALFLLARLHPCNYSTAASAGKGTYYPAIKQAI